MMRSEKGSQKNLGLRNVLTFARSVTFVLQNLSSKSEDFDNFYTPHQEKMKADPVFSFFLMLVII
jgi:ABC-type anion transport system duplicated permease subunit